VAKRLAMIYTGRPVIPDGWDDALSYEPPDPSISGLG